MGAMDPVEDPVEDPVLDPDLVGSKGTLRPAPEAADAIDDDELHGFLHAALTD